MAKASVISSLTTLPPSPADDRKRRMNNYLIAMAIRIGCILMCFVVHGWWAIIFVVGAVVIPYFAVVLANVSSGQSTEVRRPGAIVQLPQTPRYRFDMPDAEPSRDDSNLYADEKPDPASAASRATGSAATDRSAPYAQQPPSRGE